ncbi:hypothetical protein HYX05_00420 [Candidatus Woesearchaeota archaeon]|nr:hypothetical protein [Candidatus Woesearchaeota archaeon]
MFEKFGGLNIGVVIAKGISNTEISNEVQDEIREQEKEIRAKYNTETLSQNPKIDIWRKAYSAFGAKPKEHKSSVENLYRLVLQGVNLRHINKLVDIYNLISLKHMLPVGGEDIDKMRGDVILTFAGTNEVPVLLLGDKEPRPPHAGEVIYKDAISTICRRWNWREADRTKLTGETKNCVLVIEGLPPVTREEIENATKELKELIQEFCSGNVVYSILDKIKNQVDLQQNIS